MTAIATQQIRKIYAIGNALGIVERGNAEDSLHDLVSSLTGKVCGIIKKEMKVDAVPAQPFAWLEFQTCNKLIEVLKKYVVNAKKKAGDGT